MRGNTNKLAVLGAATVALALAAPAIAADAPVYTKAPPMAAAAPSPFDVAFGGLVATDYNFRGVSQSNRGPSGGAYIEGQYNGAFGQWYLGIAGYSIDWPSSPDYGFSNPAAEIDFFGGWRKEWDKASVDIGLIYYYYPKEQLGIDSDFWEIYWKGGYAVTDKANVGLNLFYTPDVLNYGAGGGGNVRGLYGSVTADYTFWEQGDWSGAISGELGHWWIKNTPVFPAGNASYTYWNAGISWTYKAVTLDLRYHGTDQSRTQCGNFLLVGAANPAAGWCKDAFIASLKFDTSLSALK